MRTVYTREMVCHLWANRHSVDVRTSSSNLYTQDGALYSYGPHFVIGAFIGDMLLVNDDRYGVTTSRHQSDAWRALAAYQREKAIRVPALNADLLRDLPKVAKLCMAEVSGILQKAIRARQNRPMLIADAMQYRESARVILDHCGKSREALPYVPADAANEQIKFIVREITSEENKARALELIAIAEEKLARADRLADNARDWIDAGRPAGVAWISHRQFRDILVHAAGAQSANNAAREKYAMSRHRASPKLAKIAKRIADLRAEFSAHAESERIAEKRERFTDIYRSAQRASAIFARSGKKPDSVARLSRRMRGIEDYVSMLNDAMPANDSEALAMFGKNQSRIVADAAKLRLRLTRQCNYNYLANAIETVADAIENYTPDNSYSVPNADIVIGRMRMIEAFGTLPDYWRNRAEPIIQQARAIAEQHRESIRLAEQEKVTRWRAGERIYVSRELSPMIRVVGDTVETSHGATVPLAHAARLVRIAERIAASGGKSYAPGEGPTVGHFRVNRIDADLSAVIGCHRITAEESQHAIALIKAAMPETVETE